MESSGKWWYSNRYFFKLLTTFTVISLIPILAIPAIFNELYTSAAMNYTIGEAQRTSENVSAGIQKAIDNAIEIAAAIAHDPVVRSYTMGDVSLQEDINRQVRLQVTGRRREISIHIRALGDVSDISTASIPALYRTKRWGVLYALANQEENYIVRPVHFRGMSGDYTSLVVAHKVFDDEGKTTGYVLVDIYRNRLFSIINELNIFPGGKYVLTYGENYTVIDTENFYLEGLVSSESPEETSLGHAVRVNQTLSSGLSGSYTVKADILTLAKEKVFGLMIVITAICLFICLTLSTLFTSHLAKPVQLLKSAMEQVGQGNLDCRVKPQSSGDLLVLEMEFNRLASQLQKLIHQRIQRDNLLKTAQLEALQAQINPHFIYNTLGGIRALSTMGESEKIETALTHFTRLLRHAINFSEEAITLQDELEIVRSYLIVQNTRFGDKFTLEVDVPPEIAQVRVPKMFLQPLVENALIHGLERKIGNGLLSIRAGEQEDMICLSVQDNGVGMDAEQVDRINRPARDGEGKSSGSIGLMNIKQRMLLYYGEEAEMLIQSSPGQGTLVTITFPRTAHSGYELC